MEITNFRIQKQLIRAKAEVIVRQELSKVQFDTKVHTKVISFLTVTIILGAFWVWCSSSPESNYVMFINEHEWTKFFFVLFPTLIEILWLGSIIASAKNIKRKLEFEVWMTEVRWNRIYRRFILNKLGFSTETNNIINDMKQMETMYEKHNDISFYKEELIKYLENFYHKFKVDLSFDFFNYLADVILIDQDLNGTLVSEANEHYIFVVEKNSEFISMVALNS